MRIIILHTPQDLLIAEKVANATPSRNTCILVQDHYNLERNLHAGLTHAVVIIGAGNSEVLCQSVEHLVTAHQTVALFWIWKAKQPKINVPLLPFRDEDCPALMSHVVSACSALF